MNAVEIEQAICKLCEAPFDQEEFPYQFLEAFGEKATTIKRLRANKNSTNKSDIPDAVLLRSNIHIIASGPRKAGKDLKRLVDSPETTKHKAKFALANATSEQLQKLLTVMIRQDRFVEGSLAEHFESGLADRIMDRAAVLAAH